MQTILISKTFISKRGRQVKIRIEYQGAMFRTYITVDNCLVSDNNSTFIPMGDDEIFPNITSEEKISEINGKLIELNNYITKALTPDE